LGYRRKEEFDRRISRDGPSSAKSTIPKKLLEREAVKHGYPSVWEFITDYDLRFEMELSLRGETRIYFVPREEKEDA